MEDAFDILHQRTLGDRMAGNLTICRSRLVGAGGNLGSAIASRRDLRTTLPSLSEFVIQVVRPGNWANLARVDCHRNVEKRILAASLQQLLSVVPRGHSGVSHDYDHPHHRSLETHLRQAEVVPTGRRA